MSLPPRRFLGAVCALVLILLGAGLVLPSGAEIRRVRDFPGNRAALHPWIAEADRWAEWGPAWLRGETSVGPSARVTAALPERGVWCDIQGLGPRVTRSAWLYSESPEGASATRVTWILRIDVGFDPLRRLLALGADARFGAQMEAALERLDERRR